MTSFHGADHGGLARGLTKGAFLGDDEMEKGCEVVFFFEDF